MRTGYCTGEGVARLLGRALVAAGPVMVQRGLRGGAIVRSELIQQGVAFPESDRLPSGLERYAGLRVDTGSRAKAHADLIERHLVLATGGRTCAELAERAHAAGDADGELIELRDTVFRGESLRAGLLGAYQAAELTVLVTALGVLVTGLGAGLLTTARTLRSLQGRTDG